MVTTRNKRKLEDIDPIDLTLKPTSVPPAHPTKPKLLPNRLRPSPSPRTSYDNTDTQSSENTSITQPIPSDASYSSSHVDNRRPSKATRLTESHTNTAHLEHKIKALQARAAQQNRTIKRMTIDSAVVVLISRDGQLLLQQAKISGLKHGVESFESTLKRELDTGCPEIILKKYRSSIDECTLSLTVAEKDHCRAQRRMEEALLDVLMARVG